MRRVLPSVLLASLFVSGVVAQQPVFVVRHAERVDATAASGAMMGTDPDLSDMGRARAQSLSAMLKDAGITAIFVTEYKRTQQTAEPLARRLSIQPTVVNAKDAAGLVERIRAATGPVLIVGHSNTITGLLAALGVGTPPKLADTEYDNLFIVHGDDVIRLHYR